MKKVINLSGRKIIYYVKKYKLSKNLRLSIRPCSCGDGNCGEENNISVLVTSPKRVSDSLIENFLEKKQDWILKKINEFEKDEKVKKIFCAGKDYQKEKRRAGKIIKERVAHFGNLYGFEIKRISIRSQRTRWGSCSKEGNLNFNYKLIYLPQEMMDYVIAHELCHLDEFNHSKKFWFLVSEIVPDYQRIRREMKKISI